MFLSLLLTQNVALIYVYNDLMTAIVLLFLGTTLCLGNCAYFFERCIYDYIYSKLGYPLMPKTLREECFELVTLDIKRNLVVLNMIFPVYFSMWEPWPLSDWLYYYTCITIATCLLIYDVALHN